MYGQFSIGGKGLKNFIQIESNKLTMALSKKQLQVLLNIRNDCYFRLLKSLPVYEAVNKFLTVSSEPSDQAYDLILTHLIHGQDGQPVVFFCRV